MVQNMRSFANALQVQHPPYLLRNDSKQTSEDNLMVSKELL